MAKRKKPVGEEYGNAINATEDLTQQIITNIEIFDGEGDPRVAILALHTLAGHYQFMIGERMAMLYFAYPDSRCYGE